jgi:hypothetical protein
MIGRLLLGVFVIGTASPPAASQPEAPALSRQ